MWSIWSLLVVVVLEVNLLVGAVLEVCLLDFLEQLLALSYLLLWALVVQAYLGNLAQEQMEIILF
jgi:hypothetical protein